MRRLRFVPCKFIPAPHLCGVTLAWFHLRAPFTLPTHLWVMCIELRHACLSCAFGLAPFAPFSHCGLARCEFLVAVLFGKGSVNPVLMPFPWLLERPCAVLRC